MPAPKKQGADREILESNKLVNDSVAREQDQRFVQDFLKSLNLLVGKIFFHIDFFFLRTDLAKFRFSVKYSLYLFILGIVKTLLYLYIKIGMSKK